LKSIAVATVPLPREETHFGLAARLEEWKLAVEPAGENVRLSVKHGGHPITLLIPGDVSVRLASALLDAVQSAPEPAPQ